MWLLESKVRENILQGEKGGFNPTAEQYTAFSTLSEEESSSRIMSIAGDTADIAIEGVLTNKPSLLAMLFGGGNTTYSDIISAIASAEQNKSISNTILSIKSPGGHVDGLFNAVAAIAAAKKPIKAIISEATSAAFALAAQADEIVAVNEASILGSVGIMVSLNVPDNRVEIASTEAPKKAPDVTTEEGQAIVREQLDALHDIFVSSIAAGRGTTIEKVNADFGRGALVIAKDAIKVNMIDSIAGNIPQVASTGTGKEKALSESLITAEEPLIIDKNNIEKQTAITGKTTREVKSMDINELKTQHTATFDAVVQLGVDQERSRVSAHLKMGEATGSQEVAAKAISEGTPFADDSVQAGYMAAGFKKNELNAREEENPDNLETPLGSEAAPVAADQVADAVCDGLDFVEGGKV